MIPQYEQRKEWRFNADVGRRMSVPMKMWIEIPEAQFWWGAFMEKGTVLVYCEPVKSAGAEAGDMQALFRDKNIDGHITASGHIHPPKTPEWEITSPHICVQSYRTNLTDITAIENEVAQAVRQLFPHAQEETASVRLHPVGQLLRREAEHGMVFLRQDLLRHIKYEDVKFLIGDGLMIVTLPSAQPDSNDPNARSRETAVKQRIEDTVQRVAERRLQEAPPHLAGIIEKRDIVEIIRRGVKAAARLPKFKEPDGPD